MRFSIITPSHDPSGLRALDASLREQIVKPFEWLVLPNGNSAHDVAHVANELGATVLDSMDSYYVGALKRCAFDQALGDVFVEVDHDDVLHPTCLSSLQEALRGKPRAMAYSDCRTVRNGQDVVYDEAMGWKNYSVGGQRINLTPSAMPCTLCSVLFSPDHVRAWTRAAYVGHDPALPYGDDHDLICRTYLGGAEFVHIRHPLYEHRLHPTSLSETRVHDIQNQSWANCDKYLYSMVEEWCRRNKLPKYDLGGYHDCPEGWEPIDMRLGHEFFNWCSGIPDGTVGAFRAHDFVEHIREPVRLMNFIWDKLAPGGYILISVPSSEGRGAYQDPTHVSFWNSNSFWYYTREEWAKYVPAIRCKFQTVRVYDFYPSEFHKLHHIPYVHWVGVKEPGYAPSIRWPSS
jgi:hypothetical protein